eukprot:Opistho-2@233
MATQLSGGQVARGSDASDKFHPFQIEEVDQSSPIIVTPPVLQPHSQPQHIGSSHSALANAVSNTRRTLGPISRRGSFNSNTNASGNAVKDNNKLGGESTLFDSILTSYQSSQQLSPKSGHTPPGSASMQGSMNSVHPSRVTSPAPTPTGDGLWAKRRPGSDGDVDIQLEDLDNGRKTGTKTPEHRGSVDDGAMKSAAAHRVTSSALGSNFAASMFDIGTATEVKRKATTFAFEEMGNPTKTGPLIDVQPS